ncbi:MAG: UDP-glucose 4-epimerase GalE [Bacteroidia bacterium]|nr:UDP-glucose 4-epimerase GalE [Bacteroidia bacterium]
MKESILVTGGLGFIGSHTVAGLQQAGYDVVIVDDLSNSDISVLDNITKITSVKPHFYNYDINDAGALSKVFADHSIKAVIHFAASKAVGESVLQPLKYYHNNVSGLISLLQIMENAGIKNIVFSSSCTVYGTPDALPVSESSPVKKATSPYGATKQVCEQILEDCKNFNSIALRYFNPIGAHESGLIGELPKGVPANLVPYITQCAAGLRDKIIIHGDDYNTSDGTCVRDYLHVTDLALAHIKAVERQLSAKQDNTFEIFNLGTGHGSTVLELITCFEKVNNLKLNYSIGPRREGDVEKVWADSSKANTILGWKTEKSLEEMLKSAWQWQLSLNR